MVSKSWLFALSFVTLPFAYASTQANLTQIVNQAPTVTSFQSPGGAEVVASGATFAIHVSSSSGLIVPDGSVALMDGSLTMSDVPILNGTATVTETFPSFGTHQLVACYSGEANFAPSCSSPLNLTTVAPYTLHQSDPSAVIESNISFNDKLSILPAKGFSGLVQLVCQAPSGQCVISPTSVTFSGDGTPQTVKATFIPASAPATIGLFFLPPIWFARRRLRRNRGSLALVAMLAITTALLGLTGCGPTVAFPFDTNNLVMQVNATSGSYSQAVMYRIQVDTTVSQ